MGKKISIILGAGASFDLIPEDQKRQAIRDNNFAPPRTSELVNFSGTLEHFLALYPRAYTAIANMRSRIKQGQVGIESMMRQLKDSEEKSKIQQFKQIPLYIQHIFGLISSNYCYHPINYATLISEAVRSDVEEVAFITTNYDLFIDQALSREFNFVFSDMTKYNNSEDKWFYVKLHGSVNWGRKIKAEAIKNNGGGIPAFLDNVYSLNPVTDLEPTIEIDDTYLNKEAVRVNHYPAITVPVDDKYEFNCPDEHVKRLKEFLKDCNNFLIIGSSGKDKDVLDLLKDNVTQASFVTLVGGSNARETQSLFIKGVPKFEMAAWRGYDKGFSTFVHANYLQSFFNDAK